MQVSVHPHVLCQLWNGTGRRMALRSLHGAWSARVNAVSRLTTQGKCGQVQAADPARGASSVDDDNLKITCNSSPHIGKQVGNKNISKSKVGENNAY